ncbi:MAG: hypothetical protein JRI92_08160 [Deltaproteobacteria bacterium]|nr:hypothetical protein [Deltaproteobacteria bacterium]MBW2590317.1 hypothetical protein [Deltaproteobacteria bacterium]
MIRSETEDFFKKEVNRLYEVIKETVPMAADGGRLGMIFTGKCLKSDGEG